MLQLVLVLLEDYVWMLHVIDQYTKWSDSMGQVGDLLSCLLWYTVWRGETNVSTVRNTIHSYIYVCKCVLEFTSDVNS